MEDRGYFLKGDKVEFMGKILTVHHIDSWFNMLVFEEEEFNNLSPQEYHKQKPPKRIL